MPQGKLFTGMYKLASDFPPSINTSDDPSKLKPFESPACYGVDMTDDGRLSTGSIPTATDRILPTKTVGGNTYSWIYNRLWRISGETLIWGAPFYDDFYFAHGLGKRSFDEGDTDNIVAILPCFQGQLWVMKSNGSYFIGNASSMAEEDFEPTHFIQGLQANAATKAAVVQGMPVVCNDKGVFAWDGRKIVELTRPVRNSLGSFSNVGIKADYQANRIIGTEKFAIDMDNGKLFDYGTSGFLYTTPTMAQPDQYKPFVVSTMSLAYQMGDTASATISWESKAGDEDWFAEDDIEITADGEFRSRIEVEISNPHRSAHKYAFRLTSMSSNVNIESIHVNVSGLALEGDAK